MKLKQLTIAREKAVYLGIKVRDDKTLQKITDEYFAVIREYEKVISKFIKPKKDNNFELRNLGVL